MAILRWNRGMIDTTYSIYISFSVNFEFIYISWDKIAGNNLQITREQVNMSR